MAQHENLNAALAAFQAELPKLRKDMTAKVTGENAKTGGRVSYSYGYADLAQVVEAVLPVLGKHGLSVSSRTVLDGHSFVMKVTLAHEEGGEVSADWPLPNPMQAGAQTTGSAMTYGRRYLTLALSGAFPDAEDDDGAAATASRSASSWENASTTRPQQPANAPTSPAAPAAPKTSWTDEEVRKMVAPMPSSSSVEKAVAVYDWMAARDLHKRTVQMDYEGQPVQVTATGLIAGRIADEALIESATVDSIKHLQTLANDRGLMKTPVSDTETLGEALYSAQELATHAAENAKQS